MPRGPTGCLVRLTLSAATMPFAGCGEGTGQSSLDPAGPAAASIAWIWWLMCAAFTAVFVLVVVLLLLAIYRRSTAATEQSEGGTEGPAPPMGNYAFVVAGGIVMPVVVLVPLLFVSLISSAALRPPEDALTVRVTGHMWWWEINYPDDQITTANEIHIPAGEPVRLELNSADVIHSFWVPSLNGKRDLIPGITNTFWIHADKPGVYRGQCAEYCGVQHANMVLFVIALPRDEYRAWLTSKQSAAARTTATAHATGLDVFRTAGCAVCHTIQGTGAEGKVGPDLTHFGTRQTVAGVLPNTRGNLAGWIGDPQTIKPGVRMPRSYLQPDDLLAVTDYLESLE